MPPPIRSDVQHLTGLTCVADRLHHAVTQEELGDGVLRRAGRFPAVCGHTIVPGSMLEPPGTPCPNCEPLLAESSQLCNLRHLHYEGVIGRWLTKMADKARRRQDGDTASSEAHS